MLKLKRNEPFGCVTPLGWIPDGCDRPAAYEQGGRLFDAHDREIVPGQPLPKQPDPPAEDEPADEAAATMSPKALMLAANTMPWSAFKKQAKVILGPDCPGGKEAIVDALNAAIAAYEARQAKVASHRATTHNGMSWDGLTGGKEAAKATPAKSGAVDVAAWGRGEVDYLVGELTKTFRQSHHILLTERRDMVNFLVEQELITAAQARRDV